MDDNATYHRTLAVQDCLDSKGIQRLVWPARFPDLNPIENVLDALESKLLVETILRQTRTPFSVHSQRNEINCLNSCWIMLFEVCAMGHNRVTQESTGPHAARALQVVYHCTSSVVLGHELMTRCLVVSSCP
ncbi:hypothetical protein TNCV_234161 [Trichonephila clavipes]|uniref:Tc1-like transposase DDE domain-containing protein n=1 Tax=Trichonephila clavipes TaxID=2585209 RepID=A0A8X6SMH8_TRICX|nr:hypothetical protein TNCV_234161 [Trichonephila clavipes]